MKILIKNKKWETSFEKVKLICEVTGKDRIFSIKFSYRGNEITIKTNNLDKTFKYLEKIFNQCCQEEIPEESRLAG